MKCTLADGSEPTHFCLLWSGCFFAAIFLLTQTPETDIISSVSGLLQQPKITSPKSQAGDTAIGDGADQIWTRLGAHPDPSYYIRDTQPFKE